MLTGLTAPALVELLFVRTVMRWRLSFGMLLLGNYTEITDLQASMGRCKQVQTVLKYLVCGSICAFTLLSSSSAHTLPGMLSKLSGL
jgi:hypothetical protein